MEHNNLLRVFPEEIWKVILANVKDAKSLENMSNSSSFFHQILLSRRILFLFPGVFETLIKKHAEDDTFLATIPNYMRQYDREGHIWKFPWGLRLVCSEWNKCIKAYLQKPKINSIESRCRYLCIPGREQNCCSVHESMELLPKFGQAFNCANIKLNVGDEENLGEYYLIFINHLRNLPNLEDLFIKCNTRYNGNIVDNQLTQSIGMNPCPKLEKLSYLSVDECLPAQILQELLRQNRHLPKLKLSLQGVQRLTFDFSTSLPNLTDLNLSIQVNEDLQRLKYFGKNWKLKKFNAQFQHFTDQNIWVEIFEMIQNNWGDTLEELYMWFPNSGSPPVASTCELVLDVTLDERLNGMKKLEIVSIGCDCAVGLDFLLPSQETLEVIRIVQSSNNTLRNEENAYYTGAKERQLVEFLGNEDSLIESNIWDLFPELHSFLSSEYRVRRPS